MQQTNQKTIIKLTTVIGILGIILIGGCIGNSNYSESQILDIVMSSGINISDTKFSPDMENVTPEFMENSSIYACGNVTAKSSRSNAIVEVYKIYKNESTIMNLTLNTNTIHGGNIPGENPRVCANLSGLLSPGNYTIKFLFDDKYKEISFTITEFTNNFDPDYIGNLSEIITLGPISIENITQIIITEDKVAFFFLHNPGCGHCETAEKHLIEVQKMFGQRVIIYKLKIRSAESNPWSGIAGSAGLDYYPFTLAVGANSTASGKLINANIGMTSSSGDAKYEAWRKNICVQFESPPGFCSEYL